MYELHGCKGTRLYMMWENIKARVSNDNHPQYKDYKGRGIKMHSEWFNSFSCFKKWADRHSYDDSLTIDRIDNNDGYYPDNCRFVGYSIQQANRNKFKNNKSGYIGVYARGKKFAFQVRFKGKTKNKGGFKSAIEAARARDYFIEENDLPNTKATEWVAKEKELL